MISVCKLLLWRVKILSSYLTFGGTTYMVSSITGLQIFLKWKYHNLCDLWILKSWKAIIRKVMIQTHTRCSILMNSTTKHRFASKVLKMHEQIHSLNFQSIPTNIIKRSSRKISNSLKRHHKEINARNRRQLCCD